MQRHLYAQTVSSMHWRASMFAANVSGKDPRRRRRMVGGQSRGARWGEWLLYNDKNKEKAGYVLAVPIMLLFSCVSSKWKRRIKARNESMKSVYFFMGAQHILRQTRTGHDFLVRILPSFFAEEVSGIISTETLGQMANILSGTSLLHDCR